MTDLLSTVWAAGRWLVEVFSHALSSTHDRVSLPYLLGALVIAVVVWFVRVRPSEQLKAQPGLDTVSAQPLSTITRGVRHPRASGARGLFSFLFSSAQWLHPSARLDYALLAARALLDATLFASLTLSITSVSFSVARLLWRNVGVLPTFDVDAVWIIAGFSIAAFVLEDLVRFVVHLCAHRIPAFWELHKLHHSAQVLTPFTIYRVHPIEGLITSGSAALAVGVLGGVVSWLFPGKLGAWTISGTFALQYVWNLLGTNLRHSHVWVSYGQRLEHVLISPAQHQVHHSDDPAHFDRNFGSALALWDWLFGTLYVTHGRQRLSFGLGNDAHAHDHDHVINALLMPMWRALQRLRPRQPHWPLSTLFRRTPHALGVDRPHT